jgi:hypothetical protein
MTLLDKVVKRPRSGSSYLASFKQATGKQGSMAKAADQSARILKRLWYYGT